MSAAIVHDLVPYAHVADVRRSIEFYAQLGFEVGNQFGHEGVINWAFLRAGKARLMLARATEPIDKEQQAVLFYLYTKDLPILRKQLRAAGVTVSEIEFPFYMEMGEMRVEDPDGYCLLIGQLEGSP